MLNANSVLATGSHCSAIKSRSSAALTLATGGFYFALVRMFNGHAPGYSNCHSGLVRFNAELFQKLNAPDPHVEFFVAGQSDRQPKLSPVTVAVSPSVLMVKLLSSACQRAI